MDEKICPKCKRDFGDQLTQPWAVFALTESDATARLIRRKNAHENLQDQPQEDIPRKRKWGRGGAWVNPGEVKSVAV